MNNGNHADVTTYGSSSFKCNSLFIKTVTHDHDLVFKHVKIAFFR